MSNHNHGNPNRNSNTTSSQIKRAENVAAFLSAAWSNLLTPSSAAEMGPRQPFSPHPPADLPLPSGRRLRRRNTYTYNSNGEGGGGGTTSTDDGDGDDGAIDSLALNFLRSSSLTLHEHEQQRTQQNSPSHQRQRTAGRNGIEMPKRSPLCTRAVLHEETSARFGGGGGGGSGILPLPFARSAEQTQQLSSTSASTSNSSSRMTSPPLSRDHQQKQEEPGSGAPSARSDPST
eukprot:scaffold4584_cov180-Skeletonema_dohrnii-CCMP3373.AAC.1